MRHLGTLRGLSCLPALVFAGCGGTEPAGGSSRELPFVVRLNEVRLLGVGDAEPAPSPGFTNTADLTRRMAEKLRKAGAFTWVSLEEDRNVTPDLELQVAFIEPDFGAGQVEWVGALFSTVTWLLAGHLSWVINNREYPNARAIIRVDLRPVSGETEAEAAQGDWFYDNLPLKGLSTNFYERADMRYWALNILVPPWWDDGDAETSGESLVDRALEYFVDHEPDKIYLALPGTYFRNRYSFLVNDAERGQVYIVTKQMLAEVRIRCDSGRKRVLGELELDLVPDEEVEEARRIIGSKVSGLGDLADDFIYRVRFDEAERGYVRITARLKGVSITSGQWTIYRDRSARDLE